MTAHYPERVPLNARLARLAIEDASARPRWAQRPSPRRAFLDLAIAALIGAVVFGLLTQAWR
jgi:hypothetical protein